MAILSRRRHLLFALLALIALVAGKPLAAHAQNGDLVPAPAIDFDKWKGLSFSGASYLAPKGDFVGSDGGIDVLFHFHAGQMATTQFKESGLNAVIVSLGYGIGSGKYSEAFADAGRFGRMLADVVKSVEQSTGRGGLHIRHLGLASWSAGFAAIGKILGQDRYYAMVDSVVLNDSIHSQYIDPTKGSSQGADKVDVKMMKPFIRFAQDAKDGKKAMVITHSSIIPPDYASSTEATQALLTSIAVPATAVDEPSSRKMTLIKRADAGNLHVRGFRGQGPHDHFEHLYLVGEALRSWVMPRWKRDDRLVYTLASEPL